VSTAIFVLCEVRLEFVSDEYSGQAITTPKFWTANKDLADHWVSADRGSRKSLELTQLPEDWKWA
jgi:hypothetical protein